MSVLAKWNKKESLKCSSRKKAIIIPGNIRGAKEIY